jgi:ferredoxin
VNATWDGTHGSLLDLAEASGVEAPSGCRSGLCGSCMVGLTAGEVDYTRACGTQPEPGQVLLCSTAPRAGSGPLTLAL